MDFLSEVERQLDLPLDEKAQVLRELKSHYAEVKEELLASGTGPAQVEQEVAHRLGDPADIASRMQQVHCRATWKSAFLAAAPLLGSILVFEAYGIHWTSRNVLSIVVILLLAVLFGGFAIRELVLNRRPVWLPTWLAGALFCLAKLEAVLSARLLGPLHPSRYSLLAVSLASLIVVGLVACWKSPEWRATVIGIILGIAILNVGLIIAADSDGMILPPISHVLILIGSILGVAFWTVIALRVFVFHRHGSPAQASLFLFAYFAMALRKTSVSSVVGASPTLLQTFVPVLLLAAVAVLIYARASTWRNKIIALAAAVVLAAVYDMWGVPSGLFVAYGVPVLLWLGMVVLPPVVYGRLTVGDRPRFAR